MSVWWLINDKVWWHWHLVAFQARSSKKTIAPTLFSGILTDLGKRSITHFHKATMLCRASWPVSFWNSPGSAFHLPVGVLGFQTIHHTACSTLRWVLWIQIQVLRLIQQVFYPLNHHPCPILKFWEVRLCSWPVFISSLPVFKGGRISHPYSFHFIRQIEVCLKATSKCHFSYFLWFLKEYWSLSGLTWPLCSTSG